MAVVRESMFRCLMSFKAFKAALRWSVNTLPGVWKVTPRYLTDYIESKKVVNKG
jgi:hypothetical protein